MARCTVVALGVLLAANLAAGSIISYQGSLSGSGLGGSGIWIAENPQFSWTVTEEDSGLWHYQYTLSVSHGDISHLILETPGDFTSPDVMNLSGPVSSWELGTYSATSNGNSNPGMPAPIHGVKFNISSGTSVTLAFDSPWMPTWGDFYSKGGQTGGAWNALWNAGVTTPDPVGNRDLPGYVPASDGSYMFKILVPGTLAEGVLPGPATVSLMIIGMAAMAFRRVRRWPS
jgi:hypothetical protein